MKPKNVECFTPIVWHLYGDQNSGKDPCQYSEIFDEKSRLRKESWQKK